MRKVWSTDADGMERYSGASSLTRRVTGSDGLWPSGVLGLWIPFHVWGRGLSILPYEYILNDSF
jgi:hypothetical protein